MGPLNGTTSALDHAHLSVLEARGIAGFLLATFQVARLGRDVDRNGEVGGRNYFRVADHPGVARQPGEVLWQYGRFAVVDFEGVSEGLGVFRLIVISWIVDQAR